MEIFLEQSSWVSWVIVLGYSCLVWPLLQRYAQKIFIPNEPLNKEQKRVFWFLSFVLFLLLVSIPTERWLLLGIVVGILWYGFFGNELWLSLWRYFGVSTHKGFVWVLVSLAGVGFWAGLFFVLV